jgi:hypothetical protein
MLRPLAVAAILPLLLLGCQRAAPPLAASASGPLQLREWLLPTTPGAAEPGLVATADGRVLLSWISMVPGRRNALQFIAWERGRWLSAPRTIVVGDALLADWADAPHMQSTTDGALWVEWSQKDSAGPTATDAMLARSIDGGVNWSAPAAIATADGGEHGFAALWPASTDTLGVAWLGPAAAPAQSQAAPTALQAALFDRTLARGEVAVVDPMACECCQVAATVAARGPLLVYRDRTPEEIRDIAASRFDGGKWSPPAVVHADGWKMPACPVNGPALAAQGDVVALAWYTAAGDVPQLRLARSDDGGAHFTAPVVVDKGAAVLGRVAVALDAGQAWVLWLREDARGQSLQLARYAPDLSRKLDQVEVAHLQGRGHATGFPQLAVRDDGAWMVWTDVIDGSPQLRGAHFGH